MRDLIEQRIAYLDKLISEKKKALENCPQGTLRICKTGNKTYYYRRSKGETNGKYISKSNEHLIKGLAQKEYDKKVLSAALNEKQILLSCSKKYVEDTVEKIFCKMTLPMQTLVTPVLLPDELFIEQWKSYQFESKPFRDDYPEYYTARGERVRSKSEIIIADILAQMGIPYRYECPLVFRTGETIYPDFTILNVKSRRTMYLEHLGMMDDGAYSENAFDRVSLYERNGIFPGDLLVMTYETRRCPLNTTVLKKKFQFYFM